MQDKVASETLGFPQPIGSAQAKQVFNDKGATLPTKIKKVKAKQPKDKGIVSMDNSVLSCEPTQQADIIRGFKIACL